MELIGRPATADNQPPLIISAAILYSTSPHIRLLCEHVISLKTLSFQPKSAGLTRLINAGNDLSEEHSPNN